MIDTSEFRKYFEYKIYECYKPSNLKHVRDYLEYLTDANGTMSPDLLNYWNMELGTKLPKSID